ncbi:MAG: cobalamin biosynthesis protein CobD [Rhodospirillales bacterium]|nr:MAG: cobalamin biosynthesis protein CobD [Rhodospirillales bacterium]
MTEWTYGGAGLLVLAAALVLDALFGEMALLLRNALHPVVAIGRVVGWLDAKLNRPERGERARFWRGVFTAVAVATLAGGVGWVVSALARVLPGGWLIEALLVAILLSQRSLYEHVAAVSRSLRCDGLAGGRAAIRHLVSRDPASLDEPGIARAALESLAENFADAVVAPVFWYAVAGLPGICAYKAINTADSMIGYRTNKYRVFGRAAARLDDAANWIPARLAALIIVAAAALTGNETRRALRVIRRDARTHASPNAGWPEAAFAGALGLALGGPRSYPGEGTREHWIGADGRRRYGPAGIDKGLRLYLAACAVNGILGGGILLLGASLG